MDPQRITELANLLRNNGDKILNSEFTLTLSGSLLRALNDSFTLIADRTEIGNTQQTFQVVKPINSKSHVFRDLQLVHDFVQKTTLLCIVHYPTEHYFEGIIDIGKFRALRRLEVQKTDVRQIVGIQPLRAQLQQIICVKSLQSVEDIITRCGGDNSNGFVWNELRIADFSYNNLQTVDTSLEFAQFLQHLNLRHNKLRSVEAIKWLPQLKTLDLSYNCLQFIPQFHVEAYKRLQTLNMSNNCIEDLMGLTKMDALTDLDLSDNCLLEHTQLLPLSALITLKLLNLYGNPLHCHPKHRLATARYLHKNTSTVKFILDFEPLTKNEKALTGSQQLRHVGALNRFTLRSSSTSINSGRMTATTSSNTPASSVGSLRSFRFQESVTDAETSSINETRGSGSGTAVSGKKRVTKMRTVDFEEDKTNIVDGDVGTEILESITTADNTIQQQQQQQQDNMTKSLVLEDTSTEHLEAKKQIETLREKYGADWLQQAAGSDMERSMLGNIELPDAVEREKSRQLFNDYLGELSTQTKETKQEQELPSSTPTQDSPLSNKFDNTLTPIKKDTAHDSGNDSSEDITQYKSFENSNKVEEQTLYASAADNAEMEPLAAEQENNEEHDEHAHLKHIYATSGTQSDAADEVEISDIEPDEDCYIVYNQKRSTEPLFLNISTNFLREKDTLTQRTKTKWSIRILESCERLKSNTLRINFDTVKKDKQERIYTVEDDLCQDLERKLRAILSQRDLTEMNIIIYRCVNCSSQFTREHKQKNYNTEVRCPDCRSTFVAEVHDIPKSLDKTFRVPTSSSEKLSPAAIVEESPVTTPLVLSQINKAIEVPQKEVLEEEDNNSIVATARLTTANNTTTKRRTLMPITKSSANSLNESSSISKITNSQCSFDSNQSVVGSSNTEREQDFRGNCCESDVDIISNPSQSSIEVLDRNASRKTSEEREMMLHSPTLETIGDHTYTQSFIEREFGQLTGRETTATILATNEIEPEQQQTQTQTTTTTTLEHAKPKVTAAISNNTLTNVLTESSSSGSVTDSICTSYEQQQTDKDKNVATATTAAEMLQKSDKIVLHNMLLETEREQQQQQINNNNHEAFAGGVNKKDDAGLSSMFGALFQSTNILMTSSKKLIDAEATANIKSGVALPQTISHTNNRCKPYKFNYTDFNDIDHRLKLYFYQTKFESGEHFKWLARGRIYNEQTQVLCDGIIIMSTCKCYIMECFAAENDDVAKWLRPLVSVTMDRLECIQLLPWKIGLSFVLRDCGGFLLLLQDILRTDSLLLYFANTTMPSQCTLNYQPAAQLVKRLNVAVMDEPIKMCSLLNGCEISCENAKRTFNVCALLATDTRLYLSSSKISWLSMFDKYGKIIAAEEHNNGGDDDDDDVAGAHNIELCVTQFMSNLVEVERIAPQNYIINFLDETQNKCELWQLTFETQENAESCLNAIGQSWEQLFGVPLLSS